MDILPPQSELWRRVMDMGAALFRLYGYEEIMLPLMEHTEVFARGIGENTDIVRKEMFTFEDKGGRSLTLRPEATAGVARAFVQHHLEKTGLPVKLYYRGPMFRHERPQAGRYRQFTQLGVELLGSPQPSADAEVILLCRDFFARLEVECELVINSVGDDACRPSYVEALREYLRDKGEGLCEDCRRRAVENPLRVLDCKEKDCGRVLREAPEIQGFLCSACREHFLRVREMLQDAGAPFNVDGRLVRGLDYYTRTVFEFQDPALGSQNSLAAGGRYDNLVEEMGGRPTPAVGFSIGLERVMNTRPHIREEDRNGVYVVAIGEEARRRAFTVVGRIRSMGIRADIDHLERSAKAQMREADRRGFRYCLLIGEDEISGGYLTLRDMEAGTQEGMEENVIWKTLQERTGADRAH